MLLPGPAVDALGILAGHPSLGAVAAEEEFDLSEILGGDEGEGGDVHSVAEARKAALEKFKSAPPPNEEALPARARAAEKRAEREEQLKKERAEAAIRERGLA